MPKTKNLNGLPNNIAKSYLSTLSYYNGGYMADWLIYVGKVEGITSLELDVFKENISPGIETKKPLLIYLNRLRDIISVELMNNGFESSFIVKAVLKFEIFASENFVKCYPFLEDINGETYQMNQPIIENSYEVNFKPKKNFRSRISSFFKF